MKDVDTSGPAAEYCGMPRQSLLRLTRLGMVPHMRIGKQKILYRRESLDRWMANLEEQSITNHNGKVKLRRAK